MNARHFLLLLLLLHLSTACKKEAPATAQKGENTALKKSLDTLFLYTSQLYLWQDQLPGYRQFSPQHYADASDQAPLQRMRKALQDLVAYAVNPLTQQPYEALPNQQQGNKYSIIVEPDDPGSYLPAQQHPLAALQAGDGGMGLSLAAVGPQDIRIMAVSKGGPAAGVGLKRGDRIMAVDGRAAETADNYYQYILNSFQRGNVQLDIADGQTNNRRQVPLIALSYTPNPVYKEKILDAGDEKIGYLAFERFTEEQNARASLTPVFQRFEQAGIQDLIIDLRYNGGGYQNSSRFLANLIAPARASGQVMFSEHYNSLMQAGKADLLKLQYITNSAGQPVLINGKPATLFDVDYTPAANTARFEKEGNLLSLRRVYFIVSKATASASELLINSLKPYMQVSLTGVSLSGGAVRTYGKPVGFFDIKIGPYAVFLSLYQTKNAAGEGAYFDGMPADVSVPDDPRYDFGDTQDPALHSILHQIAPGAYPRLTATERLPADFPGKMISGNAGTPYGLIKQINELHYK
ncbi:S41 family peptidase [Chitinophaga vietnamensis]|uniref:S41 family peptidase n=1 Tax=Chitinophaga vietnamensis TaxID=2593957 RepID=UPI001178C429|nr:S41 family peptidase [Chitinophaga vietnamensis]